MRAWAIVPAKERGRAKERLAGVLSPWERMELAAAMLADVLAALRGARSLSGAAVISADEALLALARSWGAEALPERTPRDYSGAAEAAARLAEQRGWDTLLVLPADVPLVAPRDLDDLLALAEQHPRGVVLAPDRAHRGTNALVRRPPGCIAARFGPDSLARHQQEAHRLGLPCRVWNNPRLALDIDTPQDLRLLLARGGGAATRRVLAHLGVSQRLSAPLAVGSA